MNCKLVSKIFSDFWRKGSPKGGNHVFAPIQTVAPHVTVRRRVHKHVEKHVDIHCANKREKSASVKRYTGLARSNSRVPERIQDLGKPAKS